MGIKQLYNDNLLKLPNEYGDVSVMEEHVCRYHSISEHLLDIGTLARIPLHVAVADVALDECP